MDRSVLAMVLGERLALVPVVDDGPLIRVLSLADVTDHLLGEADRRDGIAAQMDAWWPDPPPGGDIDGTSDGVRKRVSVGRCSTARWVLASPACLRLHSA